MKIQFQSGTKYINSICLYVYEVVTHAQNEYGDLRESDVKTKTQIFRRDCLIFFWKQSQNSM